MRVRVKRLQADYEFVMDAFTDHPFIRLIETEGNPPERYRFAINVKGLTNDDEGSVVPKAQHCVEVFLSLDYPRRPPFCRMMTSVFHPNINPMKICIGDHWSAGQSVVQLVVRIAEMICFQSYNTKSPLNAEAAAWAEKNRDKLPLQQGDLTP